MSFPIGEWLPTSSAVNLLAGVFLLSALAAVIQRRVPGAILGYAWNSRALGAIAAVVAAATGERHVWIAAALVLVTKGFVIPRLLRRTAARGRARAEAQSFVSPTTAMLLCGALVVIGFNQTRALFGASHTILASCLPVSVAAALVGLFQMVSHRAALAQVVGLVLMENAIFLAAISLTYGMPLVVEMGVLLDLLVGVALLGLFVGRIEESFESADTSLLTSLKG
ncbi:MAG TPA: hydrogenase [Candidatus Eisenbacteria bacterium]|jgi:hydrogenase-4 component E